MPLINDNGVVREMTQEEISELEAITKIPEQRIADLKLQLEATDYKAIKYAEGWMSEEEYAPIKAARQALRDEINALESQLGV